MTRLLLLDDKAVDIYSSAKVIQCHGKERIKVLWEEQKGKTPTALEHLRRAGQV
jgi:hypothetical protein